MTTTTLMDNLTASLRATLSCPVEEGYRLEPPTKLRVMLHPISESAETDIAVGNEFATGWLVNAYVETPWTNRWDDAEAVLAVVDSIKGWASSNREYATGYVLTTGRITFPLIQRPGGGTPAFAAIVPLQFDLPDNLR